MEINIRTAAMDGSPTSVSLYVTGICVKIRDFEREIISIAEAIAYKNKMMLPKDELEAELRYKKSQMDMLTRQLLAYR